jgi:hypothetical protein
MDWITHLCVAYIISCAFKFKQLYTFVFLIGAIMPDLSKLYLLGSLFVDPYTALNIFLPFHTVIGVVLISAFITTMVRTKSIVQKKLFIMLMSGGMLHLLLDLFLWPYGTYNIFLWPLWTGYVHTGFIWSDSIYPALITGVCAIAVCVVKKYIIKI